MECLIDYKMPVTPSPQKSEGETAFIYSLSNPTDNSIRYVGKAIQLNRRYYAHLNDRNREKTHKSNWIKNLFANGLRPKIEILDEVPLDQWQYWEIWWITQIKSWGFNLTNATDGGCGITNSKDLKRKPHSDAAKRKISISLTGKKQSEETKSKRIKSLSGENHYLFGKKRPKEYCELMRKKATGRNVSPETKKRMSEAQKLAHKSRKWTA